MTYEYIPIFTIVVACGWLIGYLKRNWRKKCPNCGSKRTGYQKGAGWACYNCGMAI